MTPSPDELGATAPRRGADDPRRAALMFAVVAIALVGFVVAAVLGDRQDTVGEPLFASATPSPHAVRADAVAVGATQRARRPAPPDRSGDTRTRTRRVAALPPPRPQYYVAGNAVALTFDDGPDPRWTPQILDLLRANRVHATFCLIGRQADAHPELVRRIVAEGNALCDHTWDHDERLPAASAAHVDWEIRSAADAITRASGGVSPVYFRAPGGNWSPVELADASILGMRSLGWSVDPRDWARPGVAHIQGVVLSARPGDIVLCHDGGGNRAQTVAALRVALPELRRRGLVFVLP